MEGGQSGRMLARDPHPTQEISSVVHPINTEDAGDRVIQNLVQPEIAAVLPETLSLVG